MSVKHIYLSAPNSADRELFAMSQWGSCWAALQFQNHAGGGMTPPAGGRINIIYSGARELFRILELLCQSDYWKRLTNANMEVFNDTRGANDKAWSDRWGTAFQVGDAIRIVIDADSDAPGIVTGLRMLTAYHNLSAAFLTAILTPEDAALALLMSVGRYGNNFFSDGSPGMYTPKGTDYHSYLEEFGPTDRDDFYYEKLVSWASIRQGSSYYDDYQLSEKNNQFDKDDLHSDSTYISLDQIKEVYLRTNEEMRALERGAGPLLTVGYDKDYEYLNNDEGDIPNDPNWSFTINGAITVPLDYSLKRNFHLEESTLEELKASINNQ